MSDSGWRALSARRQRKVSPILRPHVGAGLRQAVRDLRRRRDRLGGGAQRPARRRRPVARPRRGGVLHLRSGAALSHQRTDRLRSASTCASSSPSSCRRSSCCWLVYAIAALRSRRRCGGAGGAERSRHHRLVRQRRPDRHPARGGAATAKAASRLHVTLVSLHSLILLTILTALVELDLAHAPAAQRCGRRPHLLAHAGDDGAQHRHPPGRPAGARRPGLECRRGSRCPRFADEILATSARPSCRSASF